jgi:hypothetical protein
MMRPLTPYPVLEFVDGPAVDDTPSLAGWLDAHDNDERQLRLPVSMDKLGIGVANFEVGGIAIHVSDSALGVALADHVRTKCTGQARCRLWLEGYWSANTLHLRRVGEPVGDDFVRVAIEADSRRTAP